MMGIQLLREPRAQATVEMAVVAPVLIVLALIVYNTMQFMAATARFDRVAPDIVLAHGVAPASDADAVSVIAAQLETAMQGYDLEIEVECERDDSQGETLLSLAGPLKTYRCIMRYRPWPGALSIAGVELGAPAFLMHERPVVVDPWRSGVIA